MASNTSYNKTEYGLNLEEDNEFHHQISPERIFAMIRSASQSDAKRTRTHSAGTESIDGESQNEQKGLEDDVRKELFETIPEYPHSDDFQRVVITESSDPVDKDTITACKTLKKIIELREKWMSCHPYPPQDLDTDVKKSTVSLAALDLSSHSEVQSENGSVSKRKFSDLDPSTFRRRLPPEYNVFDCPVPPATDEYTYEFKKGLIHIQYKKTSEENDNTSSTSSSSTVSSPQETNKVDSIFPVYSFEEFVRDFTFIHEAIHSGPIISYAYKRLELLLAKFNLHCIINHNRELEAQKSVPHRDFYNIRKVDTHVHHSACMNQKHLLRFIKHKLKHVPNEIVVFRDGKFLTLGEVFKSLHLTAYDLSIDTLDMHANNTFHRFDRFNLKYNPAGQSRLREIFLKTDNVIGGRYLAEITKEVMSDLDAGKYQLVEWRVSIYGRKASEWESLAKWFYTNRLAHPNVRWLIQIPRLFGIYRSNGDIRSFHQMLYNIFMPLIEVTLDPSSNIPLYYFLQTVVGIDSVDDESRLESQGLYMPDMSGVSGVSGTPGATPVYNIPNPEQWTKSENPPYGYWMYYLYANLCVLNQLRAARGMTTFQFRPHCGEAGDIDHLSAAYLLAHEINHGILLRKNAPLQYVYYLSQIGIAMSPLSNNKLFLDYNKNPFPKYFYQGLNVSLSTDDPLMLHYTKEPLIEEYSVAAQVWKLSSVDQCEIARNSVLQSGWERKYKLHYLGKGFSDIKETNVPHIRLLYRQETLFTELQAIETHANA